MFQPQMETPKKHDHSLMKWHDTITKLHFDSKRKLTIESFIYITNTRRQTCVRIYVALSASAISICTQIIVRWCFTSFSIVSSWTITIVTSRFSQVNRTFPVVQARIRGAEIWNILQHQMKSNPIQYTGFISINVQYKEVHKKDPVFAPRDVNTSYKVAVLPLT